MRIPEPARQCQQAQNSLGKLSSQQSGRTVAVGRFNNQSAPTSASPTSTPEGTRLEFCGFAQLADDPHDSSQSEGIKEDSVIYVNTHKQMLVTALDSPTGGKRRRFGSQRVSRSAKKSISFDEAPARQTRGCRSRVSKGIPTSGSSRRATDFEAITEPIPGEIYLAYREKSKNWSPVLVLPHAHFDDVGVPDTLESLGLTHDVPACYIYNRRTKEFMWQEGYEDGGRLVAKREFPVMYFVGSKFPDRSAAGWVAADELRLFDVERSHSSLVPQRNSVRDFLRKRARTRSIEAAGPDFSDPLYGSKGKSSQQIPSSSSASGYGSQNPSSKEAEAPTRPPRIPIPANEQNPMPQDINEANRDPGLCQIISSNDQPEGCDVISISSSSTEEHIDVISINSSIAEEVVNVEAHHCHDNNHRIPDPDLNTFPEVTRPFASSAEQFSPASQFQNAKSVLPGSTLVTLSPQAETPKNRPSAARGQVGVLGPNSRLRINPMNSPVARPAPRKEVTQTSTLHAPQLPPMLPRPYTNRGLISPGPPPTGNKLPSINDCLGQTLPRTMLPPTRPKEASSVVNSPAQEHALPKGFRTLLPSSSSNQTPFRASIPTITNFRAAEWGDPTIEDQAIEPRFGVEPYDVPRQVLAKLIRCSTSGDKNPRLSEFLDKGVYSCPLCAKQYTRKGIFTDHVSMRHNWLR